MKLSSFKLGKHRDEFSRMNREHVLQCVSFAMSVTVPGNGFFIVFPDHRRWATSRRRAKRARA